MKSPKRQKEEVVNYCGFPLNQFRRTDGFWFVAVEKAFGYEAAIALNEEVWAIMGRLMTKEIKSRFSLEQKKGLEAWVEVLRLFPWAAISDYLVEYIKKSNEVFVSVANCPSQVGRLKHGLGEYDCKEMHRLQFEGMIRELGEDIRMECLFAPPDPHPPDLFCRWRFTVAD